MVWRLAAILLLAAQTSLEGQPIVAVTVSGLRRIKEAVVLEQMASRRGQPYRAAVADHDVVRLDRLGVFSAATITPVAADGGVRLEVAVVETLQMLPAASLAVTDENGASAGPALKLLSLRGRPQEVAVTARFGGEKLFEVSETSAPLVYERLWHSAKLSLRDRFNQFQQFNEHSLELDARAGLRASERSKTGAIFQTYNVKSDEDGVTLDADNTDTTVSVGVITEYDSRDLWRQPSRGWWNSVDALWRTGSASYTTFDLDVRRYQPLTARQTLVATSLLTLQSGTTGQDIPAYAGFSLGGANTVHGWDFNSRQGKSQFITSFEYRAMVVPTRTLHVFGAAFYGGMALAAFTDVGTAWDDGADFSRNVITGGGIGVRLFIPYVNMIRLDLSVGGGGLHGSLGVNEKAVAARNRVR